ncbi:MAG: cell division protein FtsQ [Pseudonocardiales bacterium]|nr:cell division protein FtsQ [Pseudonocardiales bacterium]
MTTTTPRPAVVADDATGPSRRRRPTGRRLALWVAAVVVVLALVVWLVAFSPVLGVRTVRVSGLHALTPAQVEAAARVPGGRPLVRLDSAAVVARVEALPLVESARVHTSLPGTVTITVVERTAVGYLDSGARFELVDRQGVQFRAVAARPARLPLFAVPSDARATAAARAVAGVAAALGPALLGRISSIQALDASAITLQLTDQRVVRWGSTARNADKARILPALLAQPGTHFDVTDPDQVYAH